MRVLLLALSIIGSLILVGCELTANQTPSKVTNSKDGGDNHKDHIELTQKGIDFSELKLSAPRVGDIFKTLDMAGKVGFNDEGVNIISPKYSGVVKRVTKRIGDYVEKGDLLAVVENSETFTDFNIYAPISGEIVERSINSGEVISSENQIFKIADLSNLWLDIEIYPKDIKLLKKGDMITLEEVGGTTVGEAKLFYISPIMESGKGSYKARALVDNSKKDWIVGSFVKCSFLYKAVEDGVLVKSDAIQILNEHQVVFVQEGERSFKPLVVETGVKNRRYTEIVSGLESGRKYVSKGSFQLKSQTSIGDLGEHAGCGGSH